MCQTGDKQVLSLKLQCAKLCRGVGPEEQKRERLDLSIIFKAAYIFLKRYFELFVTNVFLVYSGGQLLEASDSNQNDHFDNVLTGSAKDIIKSKTQCGTNLINNHVLIIYYFYQFKTEHNIRFFIIDLHLIYGFVTYGAIYYLLTSGYCYNFYTL